MPAVCTPQDGHRGVKDILHNKGTGTDLEPGIQICGVLDYKPELNLCDLVVFIIAANRSFENFRLHDARQPPLVRPLFDLSLVRSNDLHESRTVGRARQGRDRKKKLQSAAQVASCEFSTTIHQQHFRNGDGWLRRRRQRRRLRR